MKLVLAGTHDSKDAAEDVGLLTNAVHQNIWKYVRLEHRRQEGGALAARALFTAKKAKTARMASRAPDPPHLFAPHPVALTL